MNNNRKVPLTLCLLGNILEWCEFSLFISLSHIIFRDLINEVEFNYSTFGLFLMYSVGFLFRPIGALIIGYLGDVYSRKTALIYSILMMAIGTCVLSITPSSLAIGKVSIAVILLCRAMQGLSGGGEFTTSLVYLSESSSGRYKLLFGGLGYSTAQLGLLFGAMVGFSQSFCINNGYLPIWSWRIGFFACVPVSIFCYWLRKRVIEVETRPKNRVKRGVLPHYKEIFKEHWRGVFAIFGLNAFAQTVFYIFSFCVINWSFENISLAEMLAVLLKNSLCLLTICLFIPVFSWKLYNINKKLIVTTSILFIAPLMCFLLTSENGHSFVVTLLSAVSIAILLSQLPYIYYTLFPFHIRNAAISVPFNLSAAIFGGLSPLVIMACLKSNKSDYIFLYLSFLSFLAFFSLKMLNVKKKQLAMA